MQTAKVPPHLPARQMQPAPISHIPPQVPALPESLLPDNFPYICNKVPGSWQNLWQF